MSEWGDKNGGMGGEGMGCPTFVCALSKLMVVGCFYIDLSVCEEGVQIDPLVLTLHQVQNFLRQC